MFRVFSNIVFIMLFANCMQPHKDISFAELEVPERIAGNDRRNELVVFAKKYLGTTYQYAGIDPGKGFDCSGFVYFVFQKFNIDVPRSSAGYKSFGTSLKPEEFRLGDVLVFYGYLDNTHIGHVGIICEANGGNSKLRHASSGNPYGVTISELNSEMYTRRFYKCIDVMH
jgi:cell wall-associated NlpC family hydrolase